MLRTDGWTDERRENSIPTHKHSLRGGGGCLTNFFKHILSHNYILTIMYGKMCKI